MNIEELRAFIEVANSGGITKAAARLGLAKAVVSRRLARLEAHLGVQLVARTTRGVSLTDAGEIYLECAARVVCDLDNARETVVPTGDLRGRLRVALPLTFGPTHLTPLLAELAQQHPHLQIHMSYSARFVDLVEEGYDCAVRFGKLESSALLATRVGNIYATLVASPDYIAAHGAPETPRDLADHQAILQGTEPWQFSKDGQITTINPQGRIKADNGGAIAEAAVAGLGIALLPDGLIVDHVASGKLVHIMPGYMPPVFGIYVVRPASQFRTRKIQLLTKLLIDRFREPDCTTGPATRPLIRSPNMPVG